MPVHTDSIISIRGLSKTYASGFKALQDVNLEIRRGEIFALLGPNGAGKTTLISIVSGIVKPSAGQVTVDGHYIIRGPNVLTGSDALFNTKTGIATLLAAPGGQVAGTLLPNTEPGK